MRDPLPLAAFTPPSSPPITVAPPHRWRGAAAFNHALRQSSSSSHGRPRAGSAALRRARCPSPPSSPSCRHGPTHHGCSPWSIARTQEGYSFFQPCAPTTVVSPSPSRPLWPGPPRSARPASPRHLHRPAIAIGELTTGVRQGASPAPRRGAAAFNHALRQSSSPRHSRAGSTALGGARWPLASFTALLAPSSLSSRLFAVEHRPHPGGVQLLSTMRSNHRRLHVALAAPLAGSATQRKARFPSPPSQPCYRHRRAHHGCSPT